VEKELIEKYGNKVRVRACGLCWQLNDLLLVDHHFMGVPHFWAPPGGGIELGLPAQETLVKEFREETGLEITVGQLLFTCEYIKSPLHAIELFFEVTPTGGSLARGHDPETKVPVIAHVAYKSFDVINQLPPDQRHGILTIAPSPSSLRNLHGYIRLL
jgi:8-oxo-dGTP diphosphatase